MGCNTSQEQLAAPNVIGNEDNDSQSNAENMESDDNRNVTNLQKIEQINAINILDTTDKINKCDTILFELIEPENEEKKDTNNSGDSIRIKREMENSKEIDEEERAATKIQATFRGHRVRASMKQGDKSTTGTMDKKCEDITKSASSAAGGGASANEPIEREPTKEELEAEFNPNDKELCDAASRIQLAFRSHLTRKLQTTDINDDKDLEEITKKVAEELDIDLSDPELNKAATKIQASFRGYKARKDPTDLCE